MANLSKDCIDDHFFGQSILLSVVQKLAELLNDALNLPFLLVVTGEVEVEGITDDRQRFLFEVLEFGLQIALHRNVSVCPQHYLIHKSIINSSGGTSLLK